MSTKPTVLLLGATGFTGRLIAKYLSAHRDSASFTLALGARSKARLDAVVAELGLNSAVQLRVVDVARVEQVDAAVTGATVVINAVGPYWTWGTPVVHACVRHGVHYVDLAGETEWIKHIITTLHYTATKTGAMVVPSCGFDSVPADIVPYVASKTLREVSGEQVDIDTSVSAYKLQGGVSGGTISSLITTIEQIPANARQAAKVAYSLSPAMGPPLPPPRLIYRLPLPDTGRTLTGAFFFMSPSNRALQLRSWGLLETAAATDKTQLRYGPTFTYDEFLVTGGPLRAVLITLAMAIGFGSFMISPIRWLLRKVLPKPGEGPSESTMTNGYMKITNITTAVTSPHRAAPLQVKTVMKGKGDPGYSLTAVMIAEAALTIALAAPEALPATGRTGGVLTPVTALGDVYVERLVASGRITIESAVVTARSREGKKTV
ncbi:Saccharopine dehydrogenase-domain-containing protein [Mycena pura]|uniref:Saccharopine dehydrogenase-domain-containing protein n=1 Tax=Mycena pura TaxID=153505 RepID=A0AAD6V1T5_9AGAR|nr:Saccharopine dehydrogenase-domain-containing protein [Mycena pura]